VPQYYRVASAKLKKEDYNRYNLLCAEEGVTINSKLKKYIEADLEENKKSERTTEGLDEGSQGNIQGGGGGDSESVTAFRKEWGDCPFC